MDNTSLIGPTLAKQSSQKLTLAKQKHGKNEDLVDDQELKSDGANDDDECSEQNKLQRAVPKRSLQKQLKPDTDDNGDDETDEKRNGVGNASGRHDGPIHSMSPISQKSKRIPKHTPQYMQFVKEATNSKRLAKQRNKLQQRDKVTIEKVQ